MCLYADRLEETGWVVSEQGCSGTSSRRSARWLVATVIQSISGVSAQSTCVRGSGLSFFFFIGMYLIPNVVVSLGG